MNITWLKIPTGRRQTSWLRYKSVTEDLNQDLRDMNPRLPDFHTGVLTNHSAPLPPSTFFLRHEYVYEKSAFSDIVLRIKTNKSTTTYYTKSRHIFYHRPVRNFPCQYRENFSFILFAKKYRCRSVWQHSVQKCPGVHAYKIHADMIRITKCPHS